MSAQTAKKKQNATPRKLEDVKARDVNVCPWCGKDDYLKVYIDDTAAMVTCSPGLGGCGASGPVTPVDWHKEKAKEEAIEMAQYKWGRKRWR